ncbi:MAG: TetR/AcrR family transcriptional regulator [Pyrinomonadaceae bacterium]
MTKQPENVGAAAGAVAPPAGGGRMAGGDRRRQIVDVAMRLFSESGFRGTTTKEIAHAAGVSEAIIFRHFATKDDLYAAIIDHKACAGGIADLGRPVAEAIKCSLAGDMERKDDRAVFLHVAAAMMRHHQEDPDFLRLLLYSALEGHQLSQIFWDRNVRLMYEFLGSYIRQRQRDGAFRDADPLVVVRAFTGMIIHHSVTNILWDKSRKLLNIPNDDAALEFTEILLRGIVAGGAAAASTKTRRQKTRRAATAAAARAKKK